MTTPDTSAVRAWARDNGYEVADRGRLPAQVTAAYVAANGTKKKAAPVKRAPGKNVAAEQAAQRVARPAEPAGSPEPKAGPQPKPSTVHDDRRLVALAEEVAALAKRVEALEKAPAKGGKTSRFRRRF